MVCREPTRAFRGISIDSSSHAGLLNDHASYSRFFEYRWRRPAPQTIIISPEGGEKIDAYLDTAQLKLDAAQTNGSMIVAIITSPPGSGPPPHRHGNEDEMFMVLQGSVRYLSNGQWTAPVPPGTIVYTPRGAVHTFQNVGDTDSRQLLVSTPSGFEKFYARSAEIFAQAGDSPPDIAQLLAISDEFGIEFVPPLVVPK
jgi:quercetin dioxygenase-like cupin family protein